MPSAGVVADANVLLSAVIGKAAARVFFDHEIPVHVTAFNAREVEECLPQMAGKYGLPAELVELQWRLLPLRFHSIEAYRERLRWAEGALAERDPEDAHALALAAVLGLPLWTNDRDLQGHGVDSYTTAQLLRALGRPAGS
ncbi:MAG TPA: PIN domain-containing protein [Thermoanaerobaculia bacterium]